MIEEMDARKLCAGTQRGHISSCERFAAFVKRSPDTATAPPKMEVAVSFLGIKFDFNYSAWCLIPSPLPSMS
jgi:hypothetical protein